MQEAHGSPKCAAIGFSSHPADIQTSIRTMDLTNGVNRVRIRKACDICNSLKSKCSGLDPCSRCSRLLLPCTYARAARKRGRKPNRPKIVQATQTSELNKTTEQEIFLDESFWTLVQPALTDELPLSTSWDPEMLDSLTTLFTSPPPSLILEEAFDPPYILSTPIAADLPISTSLAAHLLSVYFTTASYAFLPILRKRIILSPVPLANQSLSPITLSLILCFAAREYEGTLLQASGHLSENLASRALALFRTSNLITDMDKPDVDMVITLLHLLMMSNWSIQATKMVGRWISMATSLARELDLNLELKFGWEEAEMRRRIFWLIWIVERITTVCFTQRPSVIDADLRALRRPCGSSLWASDLALFPPHDETETFGVIQVATGTGMFELHIGLYSIFGHIIDLAQHPAGLPYPYERTKFLAAQLEKYRASLPEEVLNPTNHLHAHAMIMFHTLYILLYGRWDIEKIRKGAEKTESIPCLEHIIEGGKNISILLSIDPQLKHVLPSACLYILYCSVFLVTLSPLPASLHDAAIACAEALERITEIALVFKPISLVVLAGLRKTPVIGVDEAGLEEVKKDLIEKHRIFGWPLDNTNFLREICTK